MKQLLLLIFILTNFYVSGQGTLNSHDLVKGNIPAYKPAFNENFPNWAKQLYQEEVNFHKIKKDYEEWKKLDKKNHKAVERYYKIWSRHIIHYVQDDGTIQLPNTHEHPKTVVNQTPNTTNEWVFLGPKETFFLNENGEGMGASCPWQVNIYSFDVAKSNDSILYSGTETGFVSKSIDHGNSWILLAKSYSFGGGITAIAIHPQNSDIVYVSAGQQMHKTTDGGENWNELLLSDGLFYADKIIIDNENPNKVTACGLNGVFHSQDGGENWTNSWQKQSYDIHFKSDNSSIIYAICNYFSFFQFIVSTDGGQTFTIDSNFPSTISNQAGGLIAVSESEPNSVFALLLSSDETPVLYEGNMEDGNWSLLATGQTDDFPLENWQGFYDLAFEVSPNDANIMFAGTSSLYKSTNRGVEFSLVGGYGGDFSIHPDVQCMILMDNDRSWLSTDGGFTFSSDNFTSTSNAYSKNNNLVGSDFWGFDQGWNEDIIVGGRYHNGNTAMADFYEEKALRMGGAESPTGWIMKGKSRHAAFNDLGPGWVLPPAIDAVPEGRFNFNKYPNMDEYGGRRGNMVFHPNYHEVIMVGEGDAIWKSNDMGVNFELLYDFGHRVRYLQISHKNPNIIYADVVNLGLHKSEDGGLTWQSKPSLTDGSNGQISWKGRLHFDISPNDPNTIYACLNNGLWSSDLGKIFKSTDGGDSWIDWTANLNPYSKCVVVQPDELGNDIVYLFTSNQNDENAYCYIRRHDENDWSIYGANYPVGKQVNLALPFFRDGKLRVAGTAGVWETNLDVTHFQPYIQPWANRPVIDCFEDTIQLDDHSILNHEGCSWNWQIEPEPSFIEDENIRNPKIVLGAEGSYDITLTVNKNGQEYSKTIENMIQAQACPSLENCNNPAMVPKDDWQLRYVNSEESNYPGLATMAFDNDVETIWHTSWSTGSDPYPHQIEIDFGEEYKIYEFSYQTRLDGENGRIKDFELYFSSDNVDYGIADTISQFVNTGAPQTITFSTPKVGRYMKLLALSEVNGNEWASAAEFDIKGCFNSANLFNTEIQSLSAHPIPTKDLLEISLPTSAQSHHYNIYSANGQIVKKGVLSKGKQVLLNLSDLNQGVYVIKIYNNNGRFYIKTIKN